MSYQYYFQQIQRIQQLAAMGMYNVPANFASIPLMQLQHPMFPMPSNDIILVESEEENEVDDVEERTLFCANLSEKITEELLYEVFLQAGPLEKIYIPKQNGKNRSYAFLTYKYRSSPSYALKLFQGLQLFGKRLDIKFQRSNSNGHNRR
ncbi:RNA-binding protein 7-like [Calliphora vicina]|uniref:RNA-binding protein 7-like n=1 Tax=Calliphora vicina TaxID=7373 RepID=UPI00325A50AA